MPLPDVLPPELWHYIISIASIDPSRLVPWLSVAPYTCAKGMHDAAFAELFRTLNIETHKENGWLEATLQLSRYAREGQLCKTVRSVSGSWCAESFLELNEEDTFYDLKKRKRSMNMLEDLVCEVLAKLDGLRDLHWSNSFRVLPIKRTIFSCLERHFPSLTCLSLSGARIDHPLDLRSATSLSALNLRNVRLTSTPSSPPILFDASLETLLLIDVLARDESSLLWWDALGGIGPPVDPSLPLSHILASLDLSNIQSLWFGKVCFSQADLSHVFPQTSSPHSPGARLRSLRLTDAGRSVLTALSHCRAFPALHTLHIDMRTDDVLNAAYAEDAIMNVSSFTRRQKALGQLSIGIEDTYRINLDRFQDEDTQAFEQALTKPYFRNALAGLKELRRLSLGTYTFWSQYPALNEEFARALSGLETFLVQCVNTTTLTDDVLDEVAQAFNRFANLRSVGFDTRFPLEDEEEARDIAEALPKALHRHAPRLQYCAVGSRRCRLSPAGVETVSMFDADYDRMYGDLDLFI